MSTFIAIVAILATLLDSVLGQSLGTWVSFSGTFFNPNNWTDADIKSNARSLDPYTVILTVYGDTWQPDFRNNDDDGYTRRAVLVNNIFKSNIPKTVEGVCDT